MSGRSVMVLTPDVLLDLFDLRREKFHRTSAVCADHVMVIAAIVLMLVSRDAVVESNFTRQTTFRQKLKRAVHSGEAYLRVLLLDEPVQLICREMITGIKERPQYRVPLLGMLESYPLEMGMEYVFGLAHHLARDRRLIVYSFL
jgi:hypothetical protein